VICPALPATGLAPTNTLTCSADYIVTQADIDLGFVTNIASASAGPVSSDPVDLTINGAQTPALSLVKNGPTSSFNSIGDTLDYEYIVTNSGNVTLTNAIAITDDQIAVVSCPALPTGGLLVGNSITCTATDTVTQADINAGEIVNIARASDGTITSGPAEFTVGGDQIRTLEIDKLALDNSFNAIGDELSYNYIVRNTGNVNVIDPIRVDDDRIENVNCPALPVGGLVPGGIITCDAVYTVTQEDLDLGEVTNIASATDGNVTSPTDQVTVDGEALPALTIVKTSSDNDFNVLGQTLTYSYQVTNAGNITLTDPITVSDDRIANVSCEDLPATGLAPNDSITCSGTDTVTQADLDAGEVVNVASASDGTTTSDDTSLTIEAAQEPAIGIEKTALTADFTAVGDTLSYEYLVTNTGNVTLTNAITVTDNRIATVSCPALPTDGLLVGGSITCTATDTVTQTDLDAGFVTNTASASDGTIESDIVEETVTADQLPALSLVKASTNTGFAAVGDILSYTYTVTNIGNVTITDPVTVSDDRITTVNCPALPAGGLTPTTSITCSADYSVTQDDLDAGAVTNIASASDGNVTSPDDSVTIEADALPALTLAKTSDDTNFTELGQTLTYSYVVTNAGNVTLTDAITVSDDRIADVICPALPDTGLAPGDTLTCTGTDVVTQLDLDAGFVTNTASATDGTSTSPDTSLTIDGTALPALNIVKEAVTDNFTQVGDIVSYEYSLR